MEATAATTTKLTRVQRRWLAEMADEDVLVHQLRHRASGHVLDSLVDLGYATWMPRKEVWRITKAGRKAMVSKT